AFGAIGSGTTESEAGGIWINPLSANAPMGSYYLGDTLGDWYVNFEIGQASWNDARVGLGTSLLGASYAWGTAYWYEDGEGANKRVRRNLNGVQFTATGNHYVICQAKAAAEDSYTSKSGAGWGNSTVYPPADLSSAYFAVEALTAPADVTAATDGTHSATRVDLGWTRWNDRNVLITVATATPSGSPTQGQAYGASDTFGNQTVVAGSQSGTSLEVTGLIPGVAYYFTFYSENSSYYSAGATATAVATALPQARNTSGGSPQAPSAIHLGDSGLTFGFDSWGQIEANYGAARLWLRHDNADLTGGTAGDWSSFVNDENKTRASGVFNQTGTWYWGLQMDYGSPYGTNFWYKAAGADWADLSASGSGATLSVTVSAIDDPSAQTATRSATQPISAIDLSWTPNAQGNPVMIVRKLAASSWTEPAQGTAYAVDAVLGAGTVVYVGTDAAATASGLADDTTYDFKFYSVNNDYYSAGVVAQASTRACEPAAPTGLRADPTNYVDFVANWSAVDGATGYRLDVSESEEFGTPTAATDLFFSEYVEGASNEKYVEIYNGTGASVDLSDYALMLFANGATTPTASNTLSGTLANGAVAVYRNASATNAIGSTSSSVNYNGDDAIALRKKSTGAYVDIFGRIGEDPGTAWTSGSFTTLDKTLVRKSTVAGGVTSNPGSGFPTLATEWDQYAISDESHLNAHVADFGVDPSYVAGFENLAVAGTSASVTGLTEGVTYYFRVRAEGEGGCPSVDSSVASVATLEHLRPEISQATVNVREGGEGRIFVRLNKDPGADVVVAIARSAGDAGLSIQDGATRNFKSSNWSSWQTVTLVEAADEDAADETATFQVSMSGADDQFVEATALDDDIGENLALATGGSAISASAAYSRPEQLIDGVHASSVNYGYVVCTSATPGTITLDLKAISTVSRVRVLTWDWVRLVHRYTIESSSDGSNWTTLIDATSEDHHGWDNWTVANVAARYLRFTGESTTQGQGALSVPELEVYGTRDLSGLPQPALSASALNVREAGEGRFFLR
ncbi:MAG TPA: lamin tail domain-containing protein, partial [Kiritimatiellia bacterium]|nr:lamin tail domain-containing protein [Kiritimatiellia bacterium]